MAVVHAWHEGSEQTVCGLDVVEMSDTETLAEADWVDHVVRLSIGQDGWCTDCELCLRPDVHRCMCEIDVLHAEWRSQQMNWLMDAVDMVLDAYSGTSEDAVPMVVLDIRPEDRTVELRFLWTWS
jgi:hypothetical protein